MPFRTVPSVKIPTSFVQLSKRCKFVANGVSVLGFFFREPLAALSAGPYGVSADGRLQRDQRTL